MARRTDTKTAILIQVMDELGFDQETIAKVSKVPQRTVSDVVKGMPNLRVGSVHRFPSEKVVTWLEKRTDQR